jgi:DNA-binding LytR/AlgR family response regulator
MRVLIADDDPLTSDVIAHHLGKLDPGGSLHIVTDGSAALKELHHGRTDLLVLDLHMPGMGGRDVLDAVGPALPVIVVTGDRDFAVEAFRYNVVDYLVKPVVFERFAQAWRKLGLRSGVPIAEQPPKDIVFVRSGSEIVRLDLREVRFIRSESNYVRFHLKDRTVESLLNLKDLERKLPPAFVRVHRSYIVNLLHVEKLDSLDIKIGSELIPVSDSYRTELIKRLDLL